MIVVMTLFSGIVSSEEIVNRFDQTDACTVMVSPTSEIFYDEETTVLFIAVGGCYLAEQRASCDIQVFV